MGNSNQRSVEPDQNTVDRSRVADEIDDLKTTILRLAKDRERLPQPLFWSLFNSRLKDIKRSKEIARMLDEVLGS
jgi:TATA-binding protein-associated factor Taf7